MTGDTDSFLEIGGRFGVYEVVRELGRGGMGAVYLVRDPSSGVELAAKVMYPEAAAVREFFVKRFIREAEIAMTVSHPNLVKVYDVGRDPDTGLAYMLMDYLPGGSLRDVLVGRRMQNQPPLRIGAALEIVRQVAGALGAASAHGVVHRDIKPANILFDGDGISHLADLGVAKVQDGEFSTTTLTMSNVMVGSPAYMAPEQMLDAHAADTRADIYSLGIVLWEMLAGVRPNSGASTAELMARALRAERIPDIRTRRKNLPAGVATLVRRMTEPEASRRFASPEEVVRFIDEWREWEKRRLRIWLVGSVSVGVAVALSVLAGGIWYVSGMEPAHDIEKLDVKIRTAEVPSLKAMIASAELKAREAISTQSVSKAAKPVDQGTPVRHAESPQTAHDSTVASEVRNAAPKPVLPKPSPSIPTPPPAKRFSLEGLMTLFTELSGDPSGAGRRQIDAAVNAARKIDPDLSMVEFDGTPAVDAVRVLSEEESDICLKGKVFLRMEIFRRKNGRLPTYAEAKALFAPSEGVSR